jgi:hypothetical protein
MSNFGDALAWRPVFEIVKSIEKPVGAPAARQGRRYQRRFTVYGTRRPPGQNA